jgi:hypothetical protein
MGTQKMHDARLVGRVIKEQRARARQILLLLPLHTFGLKAARCRVLLLSICARFPTRQAAKTQESITTPFFCYSSTALQRKKNKLSIILVKRDKSISLAIEFDEIANGKDLRTDDFLLSHNKFALLARLRNGSRNIFVCFVLGEACIPAIFPLPSQRTRPFLARTRLLIS